MKNKLLMILAVGLLAGPMAANAVPMYDDPIFLRGTFNGWAAVDVMVFDAIDEVYETSIELGVGPVEFKVASFDFAAPVDLGASAPNNVVMLDVALPMEQIGFNNAMLDIVMAGIYSFTLNTATGLETPTILVSKVPEPSTLVLFSLGIAGLGFARRKKA